VTFPGRGRHSPPLELRSHRVETVEARPLTVPLVEPFIIASGRVDTTRAVEVRAVVSRGDARAEGIGEAAALPPVTREDQPQLLASIAALGAHSASVGDVLDALDGSPVARAGVETAIVDAIARIEGVPVRALLGADVGASTHSLETDVTLPIATPERMADNARAWHARGFRVFKVKVGKDLDADLRALEAIGRAAPGARYRIDANAAFDAKEAIAMARAVERLGLAVECWEQPCGTDDLDAMAEVARALDAPVIADESVKTLDDLVRVVAHRAADGVNLKLAKSGGPLAALAIGRAARLRAMPLMMGGMVETRLGMTAAAHVAAALGGVDFVDLDTALLLADDPYEGGYEARGPRYALRDAPGLDVRARRVSLPPRTQ
jgi:L-alanine-DL-glutamate epimerase-like enolase superfamily enzyme